MKIKNVEIFYFLFIEKLFLKIISIIKIKVHHASSNKNLLLNEI